MMDEFFFYKLVLIFILFLYCNEGGMLYKFLDLN